MPSKYILASLCWTTLDDGDAGGKHYRVAAMNQFPWSFLSVSPCCGQTCIYSRRVLLDMYMWRNEKNCDQAAWTWPLVWLWLSHLFSLGLILLLCEILCSDGSWDSFDHWQSANFKLLYHPLQVFYCWLANCKVVWTLNPQTGLPCTVSVPAVSNSPGSLTEMQISAPSTLWLRNSGGGSKNLALDKPSEWFYCVLMCDNSPWLFHPTVGSLAFKR